MVETIITILNINIASAAQECNAGIAVEIGHQTDSIEGYYIGRHICDIIKRPEYAGEPKNVQALTHQEYIDSVKAVYGYEISCNECKK